jgi:hypothetical protein
MDATYSLLTDHAKHAHTNHAHAHRANPAHAHAQVQRPVPAVEWPRPSLALPRAGAAAGGRRPGRVTEDGRGHARWGVGDGGGSVRATELGHYFIFVSSLISDFDVYSDVWF